MTRALIGVGILCAATANLAAYGAFLGTTAIARYLDGHLPQDGDR